MAGRTWFTTAIPLVWSKSLGWFDGAGVLRGEKAGCVWGRRRRRRRGGGYSYVVYAHCCVA